jgi:hypothetical protein
VLAVDLLGLSLSHIRVASDFCPVFEFWFFVLSPPLVNRVWSKFGTDELDESSPFVGLHTVSLITDVRPFITSGKQFSGGQRLSSDLSSLLTRLSEWRGGAVLVKLQSSKQDYSEGHGGRVVYSRRHSEARYTHDRFY